MNYLVMPHEGPGAFFKLPDEAQHKLLIVYDPDASGIPGQLRELADLIEATEPPLFPEYVQCHRL